MGAVAERIMRSNVSRNRFTRYADTAAAGRASRRRLAFALRLARALLDGLGASGATTGAWAGSTTTSILRGRSVYVSQAANTYCHQ